MTTTTTHSAILSLIFLAMFAAMYLLPTIVAKLRNHRQLLAIAVLNVLLGWSVIGWIVAIVWALTTPPQVVVVQNPPNP